MEEWPPKNYDYKPQMEKEGIRLVETKYWKIEPDVKDGKRAFTVIKYLYNKYIYICVNVCPFHYLLI